MIIIPARNEAASIAWVIEQARRVRDVPIVVIDDASDDETADRSRAAGATVLRLPLHLGNWGALQTGIRYARRQGWDLVVTLDADGQHDPADIPSLLAPVIAGAADVAIGACPPRVTTARRLAWHWFRGLSGIAVEDLTSGFRVYNRRAMELLCRPNVTLLDYQDVGVLLILRRQRLRIQEIPVIMQARASGQSRVFDSWLTVGRYMMRTSLLSLVGIDGNLDQTFPEED